MNVIANRALQVSPSLTLEITAKGKKMKEDGLDVVSFGAGEPDFNTPAYINEACKAALDGGLTKYTPASGAVELRKAIAAKLKKDNGLDYVYADIVVSNGAKHSLYNAFMAIVNPGDEVIIPAPYWLTYPELVKLADGVPVIVNADAADGFKLTPRALKAAVTKRTRAFVLNNPSNPTGAVYTEKELRALAEVLEDADIYVIADEIYEKLCYGIEPFSIAAASERLKHNTIVVNGLSKTYSMTGWRVGYTASNGAIARAMGGIQSHATSNANTPAQYASIAALQSPEGEKFLSRMRATFDRRRRLAVDMLKKMRPLTFVEPQGAFYIMAGIGAFIGKTLGGVTVKSASDFANLLIDRARVVVIPCESFGAPEYIRLSYAVSDENIVKGLNRIARMCAEFED
ncbi:MAG: pyridoxal phosphate-dependent aminotransferase [Clostridiales bacterium]|jgi:aspartate aminotransferase|nr:pyridoxal phosphate-dependent aminotransferase [Clostridiales bacterium]